MELGRYMRTVRYLRAEQVVNRALRRVLTPRFDLAQHPRPRAHDAPIVPPIRRTAEWLSPTRVRILNLEREMTGCIEWAPPDAQRLWIYHLHYFADLPGRSRDESDAWRADLILDWIESNPPGTPDAWDPYPTSLRTMNWIKWLLDDPVLKGARREILTSLAVQMRHLERSVERDLSANHLFANAAALTIAGLFFADDEGDRWLRTGSTLLSRELDEQVLADGGHYERSPMYHSLVLEQVLDVLNVWAVFGDAVSGGHLGIPRRLESAAARMLTWLETMVHPDGEVPFFNDSTFGVAPTLQQLSRYAGRLGLVRDDGAGERPAGGEGPCVRKLPASGYYSVASADRQTVLLFDAGPIGPDHQPGHGHCDALSFEISRAGRRVFVNSGISTYERGPERLRQRRTAAHNAVTIDGQEQCELWGSHRCGRRLGILAAGASEASAEGTHTGYAHLRGRPLHHRTVSVDDASVRVRDGFDGGGEHLIEWYLRVHPDCEVVREGTEFRVIKEDLHVCTLRFWSELRTELQSSTWHPGFNLSVDCALITAAWRGPLPADFELEIAWGGGRRE